MPHRDQEIAMLRREVELLMGEREVLLRVAGSAAALIASLESMHNYDLGGYRVSYSANDRQGSRFVDLTVIGSGGRVLR